MSSSKTCRNVNCVQTSKSHVVLYYEFVLHSFSLDPTLRYTIWSSVIGNTAKIGFFPLAQSSVQRIGCMPTIKDAYRLRMIISHKEETLGICIEKFYQLLLNLLYLFWQNVLYRCTPDVFIFLFGGKYGACIVRLFC